MGDSYSHACRLVVALALALVGHLGGAKDLAEDIVEDVNIQSSNEIKNLSEPIKTIVKQRNVKKIIIFFDDGTYLPEQAFNVSKTGCTRRGCQTEVTLIRRKS